MYSHEEILRKSKNFYKICEKLRPPVRFPGKVRLLLKIWSFIENLEEINEKFWYKAKSLEENTERILNNFIRFVKGFWEF